jgi:hypothetical protein
MKPKNTSGESTDVKDFLFFGALDKDLGSCKVNDLMTSINYACDKLGIDSSKFVFNHKAMTDIVDLVERERVYFWIFHKTIMGELNEISLICYWILKFRPFYSLSNPDIDYSVIVSMFLFTNIVTYVSGKDNYIPL